MCVCVCVCGLGFQGITLPRNENLYGPTFPDPTGQIQKKGAASRCENSPLTHFDFPDNSFVTS